jgi:hypothetical protein
MSVIGHRRLCVAGAGRPSKKQTIYLMSSSFHSTVSLRIGRRKKMLSIVRGYPSVHVEGGDRDSHDQKTELKREPEVVDYSVDIRIGTHLWRPSSESKRCIKQSRSRIHKRFLEELHGMGPRSIDEPFRSSRSKRRRRLASYDVSAGTRRVQPKKSLWRRRPR